MYNINDSVHTDTHTYGIYHRLNIYRGLRETDARTADVLEVQRKRHKQEILQGFPQISALFMWWVTGSSGRRKHVNRQREAVCWRNTGS